MLAVYSIKKYEDAIDHKEFSARDLHARASREDGMYVHCKLPQKSKSCKKTLATKTMKVFR